MSNNELKLVATAALNAIFAGRNILCPITSMDLLTRVMSFKTPIGLLPNTPPPNFRLTDLSQFEHILEDLSNTWNYGTISFSRDYATGEMMVWEVVLDPSGQARLGGASTAGLQPGSRKRKRVVDEDADSAAGNDNDEEEEEDIGVGGSQSSTLANLTNQLREVYAILQKSTAKGKLLAEQVCFLFPSPSTSLTRR